MNLLSTQLIEETKQLIFSLKLNYMAIAENLYRIHESWTGTADEWVDFYENDIDLHKSMVSKMLKVGPASIQHGWRNESVSIEKLYNSLNRNKKNPELALAEAKTWIASDYREEKKDDGHEHAFESFCKICWKHE